MRGQFFVKRLINHKNYLQDKIKPSGVKRFNKGIAVIADSVSHFSSVHDIGQMIDTLYDEQRVKNLNKNDYFYLAFEIAYDILNKEMEIDV